MARFPHILLSELGNICGDGSPRDPTASDRSWRKPKPDKSAIGAEIYAKNRPMNFGPRAPLRHVMLSELGNICGDGSRRELADADGS